MTKKKKLSMICLLLLVASSITAWQVNIGKTVSNVKIKTPDDKASPIPFWGQKVMVVFYTDPDVKDVNDPLSDAIKAKNFPKEKYAGIGIANCKDTWLPNSMIRYAGRQKQSKYPSSVILVDDDHVASKAWSLGDCDEVGYVLVIGVDMKIKYAKAIKNQAESKAIITTVTEILESEIAKH